jgi:hypothetical protein
MLNKGSIMDKSLEKQTSILSIFENLDKETKHSLADIDSPLSLGLIVLTKAEDQSQMQYISAEQIVEALEAAGIAVTSTQITKAFARAGNKLIRKVVEGKTVYRVMIAGRKSVEKYTTAGKISVSYIEAGKPRTARKILADILGSLNGEVMISDPYYGERTLDSLELIPPNCKIRFLTAKTTENTIKLNRAISDYKKENPKAELRLYPSASSLHDRYIISDNCLMILGHGIKDIGNRESFIVIISKEYSKELIETVTSTFNERWLAASPL